VVALGASDGERVRVGTQAGVLPHVVSLQELVTLQMEVKNRRLPPQVGGVEKGRDARQRVHAGDDDPMCIVDHPEADVVSDEPGRTKRKGVIELEAGKRLGWGKLNDKQNKLAYRLTTLLSLSCASFTRTTAPQARRKKLENFIFKR